MTTSDENGLVQFQTSDPVTPLQTSLNLISSSVSSYLNTTVQNVKVANSTQRDNLANTKPPSATQPLLVWQENTKKFWFNSGDGWKEWPIIPDIPEQTVVHYAGVADYASIAAGKVRNVDIVFADSGVTIDDQDNWIPIVTLRNARSDLPFTIKNYFNTGFTVNIKNNYSSETSGGEIYWALLAAS